MSCYNNRAERYIKRRCIHEFHRVIYRPSKNLLSLQKICIKTIEDNLSTENVFNVLLHAKILNFWKLRENTKTFIWNNIKLMKENFKNLEKTDSEFFEYVIQILLDVYRFKKPKEKHLLHGFGMRCINDHDLFTKINLTLEDLFIAVLERGLHEGNALAILMAAYKLNAKKVIEITRRYVMNRRKCPYMRIHWVHLLSAHRKMFFIAVKIMMEIGFEHDTNVFNSFEVKHGTKMSNYCSICREINEQLMKKSVPKKRKK